MSTKTKRKPAPITKKITMIPVTRDIPPPAPIEHNAYPMLEVEESFFVANKVHNQLAGVLKNRKNKLGQTHICRSRIENGVKGLRVWRIA
jgi:hypothetical protein